MISVLPIYRVRWGYWENSHASNNSIFIHKCHLSSTLENLRSHWLSHVKSHQLLMDGCLRRCLCFYRWGRSDSAGSISVGVQKELSELFCFSKVKSIEQEVFISLFFFTPSTFQLLTMLSVTEEDWMPFYWCPF